MLKNYVSDNDLQKFFPNLNKQLWTGQASYADFIDKAYELVLSDLYNKNLNPRLIMMPLTMEENVSVEASNQKRLVVNVTSVTGEYSVSLEGSNDNVTFSEVAHIDNVRVSTTYSVTFNTQFKYYRYFIVAVDAGTITATAELVETNFDNIICYKALELIFRTFIKEDGDTWQLKWELTREDYQKSLDGLRFYYDLNDDGKISEDEKPVKSWNMTFVR